MMQVPAEVTTNRKNKIHKTWGRQFSRALPSHCEYDPLQARYVLRHGLGRWGRSLERVSLFSSVDRNGILMWVRKTEEMATQKPRGRRSAAASSGLRWQPFQTTNSCVLQTGLMFSLPKTGRDRHDKRASSRYQIDSPCLWAGRVPSYHR